MLQFSTTAIILFGVLYFFPTIIAAFKGKANTGAIFALNLFLGWTIIGWVISLVWSLTSDVKSQTIIVNQNTPIDNLNASPAQGKIQGYTTTHPFPMEEIQTESSKKNSHQEKITQLEKLKQLFDSGILTQEEFNIEKSKILLS